MKLVGAEIKVLVIIKFNSSGSIVHYTWKVLGMLVIIFKE